MNRKFFSIPFSLLIITLIPHAFAEFEDTIVVIDTADMGRLIIEFFPDVAPNHVENFVKLSEDGIYTGTILHRIIEGFMIQGGDPLTAEPGQQNLWGTGSPGYTIDSEFNKIEHKRGIVSMARSSDPNSAGSQFFIVHKDSTFLDGQYTVFGRIVTDESFETLDKIASMATTPTDQPMQAFKVILENVQVLDRSELDNLPKYIPPKLNEEITIQESQSQNQTFEEYGVSFSSPVGWLVQTPSVTSITSPQIAIVGPKTSSSMPAISIRIDQSTQTIDEHVEELRKSLSPLIANKALEITGESKTKLNNYNAYIIKAIGHFEDKEGTEQLVGFSSVMIKEDNLIYTFQYTNTLDDFNSKEKYFKEILNSIVFFTPQPMKTGVPNTEETSNGYDGTLKENEEGGGCLIATAAFGSEMAPQVQFLREIRDNTVMTTQSGTAFMTGFNQFYYSFSPYVADYERENPVFKEAVKVTLTPLLTSLTLLNYVDVDSEQEMLGYGIGIILLNIGMYFVAPAAAIIVIKSKIKRN